MGAVLCSDGVKVPVKSHTSTFGGNPLACAAALVSLEIIERDTDRDFWMDAKAAVEYGLVDQVLETQEKIKT